MDGGRCVEQKHQHPAAAVAASHLLTVHALLPLSLLSPSPPYSYGYDPLGLGKDKETVEKYRANELIHARWAMLAAAGIIIPEGLQVRQREGQGKKRDGGVELSNTAQQPARGGTQHSAVLQCYSPYSARHCVAEGLQCGVGWGQDVAGQEVAGVRVQVVPGVPTSVEDQGQLLWLRAWPTAPLSVNG